MTQAGDFLVPHGWEPRWYQENLWQYLYDGGKRAIEIAHRRWGKDDVALNFAAVEALRRQANYWHCLPEYAQARKAIWNAVDPHTGKRRIDEAFPPAIRADTNNQEMFIRFNNGSTWQVIGSDTYNNLVGAGVAGVTFSEWALANPSAWAFIRPMLAENDGYALFISTPRGNNHAKSLYDLYEATEGSYAEISDITHTRALTGEQLHEALDEYEALYGVEFGRALFEQEYLCSFSGAMVGAYFGAEIARAERAHRIREVDIDWSQPVHTAWDLGKAVNNPIWCFQVIQGRPRIVDFYQPESEDVGDWVEWLKLHGYTGTDYVPHDVMVTEWGSGRSRIDTLRSLGRKPNRIPRVSLADGLQAGRATINEALFHASGDERGQRVALGVEGLKSYRRVWDDDLKRFRDVPLKDWSEHIGSAFRYLSLAWRNVKPPAPPKQANRELTYEVRDDGLIVGNMTVREAVEAMKRRKRT